MKNFYPREVFSIEFNPPKTDGSGFIRKELSKATSLLKDAGWELNEGKLINKESGKYFEFEIFWSLLLLRELFCLLKII